MSVNKSYARHKQKSEQTAGKAAQYSAKSASMSVPSPASKKKPHPVTAAQKAAQSPALTVSKSDAKKNTQNSF